LYFFLEVDMNLALILREVVKKVPKKIALIEGEKEQSYAEMWARIEMLALSFYKSGVREGSRVALMLPNSFEFIHSFFALFLIEAIVSPLSPELTTYELKAIFSKLNPHAIIAASPLIGKMYDECPELLHNKTIVSQGVLYDSVRESCYNMNELSHAVNYGGDRMATINYTYRGLGYPLGAMLTHANYVEGVSAYARVTGISGRHKVLSLLPLSHVFALVGCVLVPLFEGATIIILRNYLPRSIAKCIEVLKINYLTAVPSIFALLLKYADNVKRSFTSLDCCISGGAYIREALLDDVKTKICAEVLQGYGLTECLALTWAHGAHSKEKALGVPLREDFQIKIVDSNGSRTGAGEVGEIIVKAPTIMRGYYKQDEETRMVLEGGWLRTGDYGYVDAQGYLQFEGLKKDVAKVGGNMVDLLEVKGVLLSHPFISRVSIYRKEDDLWGDIVVAEVALSGAEKLTVAEVKSFCRRKLSLYKVPREVFFAGEEGAT
jgi:long-chain acyl-CoA synthetase